MTADDRRRRQSASRSRTARGRTRSTRPSMRSVRVGDLPRRTYRASGSSTFRGRVAAGRGGGRGTRSSVAGTRVTGTRTLQKGARTRRLNTRPSVPRASAAQSTRTSGKVRHSLKPLIIVGLCALACLVAFFVLRSSSLFTVENVAVSGVSHLTTDEMMTLVDVSEGTTLLQVDTQAIKDRLLQDAWIEDAKVSISFPHTLQVDVTERTIRAVVEVPTSDGTSTTAWAIASDGMWLMPIPDQNSEAGQKTSQQIYTDMESALRITDVPYSTQPAIGSYCSDANVENALAIVVGLTTDIADQVTAVAATETESTTLTLSSGIEIVFGAAEDIREKERVCLAIMEEHEGSLAYINVTDPQSPTWRSL